MLHEDQLCLLPLLHHLLSQQGREHKGLTRAEISVCKYTGNLKWLGMLFLWSCVDPSRRSDISRLIFHFD